MTNSLPFPQEGVQLAGVAGGDTAEGEELEEPKNQHFHLLREYDLWQVLPVSFQDLLAQTNSVKGKTASWLKKHFPSHNNLIQNMFWQWALVFLHVLLLLGTSYGPIRNSSESKLLRL